MSNYALFLDDVRMPNNALYWECSSGKFNIIEPPKLNWRIVRSYKDFVGMISKEGLPKTISFDHDLSEEHYIEGISGQQPKYDEYKEKTGYDALKWLIEYCLEKNHPLPKCYVHSFNPVGRENMFSLIESYTKNNERL